MPPRDLTTTPTLDPVEDITRRRILTAIPALGLVAAGINCGDDDTDGDTGTPGTAAPASRTFESIRGPIEVPAAPKVVVCVDTVTPMALLDVGFTPAGIIDAARDGANGFEHKQTLNQIEVIGGWLDYDYERIAALAPDVIIGAEFMDAVYDQLSAIAPTILLPSPTASDWKEQAEMLADIVGRKAKAEHLRVDYEERVEEVRSEYAEAFSRARWSNLWTYGGGEWYAFLATNPSSGVLLDAGITLGEEAYASDVATYSMEQLILLDQSGVILVYDEQSLDGGVSPETQEMFDLPLWQQLPAVKAGHVYTHATSASHYKAAMTLLNFAAEAAAKI